MVVIRSSLGSPGGAVKLASRQEDGLARPRNNLRRHGFTSGTEEEEPGPHFLWRERERERESGLEFE